MKEKKIIFAVNWLIVVNLFINHSCKKEAEETQPPDIWLKRGYGYVGNDTIIAAGSCINFGIMASKGSANITNIVIKRSAGDIEQTYLDSGLNSASIDVNKIFFKGNDVAEVWSFTVMDKNRNRKSILLTIIKDSVSAYSNLVNFPLITLGAQNNADTGSFLSLSDSMVYLLQGAYNQQEEIDMLYYYGPEGNTMASPGANVETGIFTGPYALENWSIRWETRYIKVGLSPQDFDQLQNDSLLISLYFPPDGKRKAKNLTVDDVYVFLSPDNRLGILRIADVTGTNAGSIEVYIKIQQP